MVRELRKSLPVHILTWLDEEQLLIGDELDLTLESVIKTDVDYVVLFLDSAATASTWVRKEIAWAITKEAVLGRQFLLPVIIDKEAASELEYDLTTRKHLSLRDFTEASLKDLATLISTELFALVCRDLQRAQQPRPETTSVAISKAEELLASLAALVRKAVFPHRRSNPILLSTLHEVVNSQATTPIDRTEFEELLNKIAQRQMISGLSYDGYELYVIEEHSQWKAEINKEQKEAVARRAASFIQNDQKVAIDAGSTTGEIVKSICKRIETRSLTRVTLVTTSIDHADQISDCCVRMGFDDHFSAVRLIVPGGIVRPATQAITPAADSDLSLKGIAYQYGGFDIAMLGVNGVTRAGGFTTEDNAEVRNKLELLAASDRTFIVSDSSKVGICLSRSFASFDDDVVYIVNDDQDNDELMELCNHYGPKVVLA